LSKQIKPKEQKLIQQAQTLLSQNSVAAAKEALLDYSRKNKTSSNTKYLLSICHAISGEPELAQPLASLLVKEQPKNIEFIKLLGSVNHDLKNYTQAGELFKKALKLNPNDVQALSNLAGALKELQENEEAESCFIKTLELQPNQPDALTNYGLLKQSAALVDEAIELHRKALQYSPEHVAALYNLAFALNEKGGYDASLKFYQKVLQVSPNHVRALCDISYVYGKLKQPELSLPHLERARLISPGDPHVHFITGITHKALGDIEKATSCLEETVRLEPDNQSAKYHLAILTGDKSMTSSPDKYVEDLFDNYAETFDDHLTSKLQYKTPELIANMLKKHINTDDKYKILDLGCGTGLAGTHFQEISEHMVGIDLSSKMLKKAEQRNIYNELIATGIEPYFDSHDFRPDIVISADVFVYIGDIAKIFEQVSSALENDGVFVFSTEDADGDDDFVLRESGRFAHHENYIKGLAKANQLTLLDCEQTIIRYDANKPIHGQVYLFKK